MNFSDNILAMEMEDTKEKTPTTWHQ